ncbi:delta-6 fatty acid desaturase [Chlamydoabsidia padenii]|nr:delta-6 fatty acid desaturase [Chlamydoabsidia padenii]
MSLQVETTGGELQQEDSHSSSSSNLISAQEFQQRVKQGESLFIFDNKVYKVDDYISRHPGGELVLRHSVGRDVTDEIRCMHPPSIYNYTMKQFYIGDYLPAKIKTTYSYMHQSLSPKTPSPIQKQQQPNTVWTQGLDQVIDDLYATHADKLDKDIQSHDMVQVRLKYQALEQDMKDRGLFQCNPYRYAKECCRFVGLFYTAIWLVLRGTHIGHYVISATCLAVLWHQLVFTAHDAGHNEITGRVKNDHLIGLAIANFCGGLSIGWWKDNHHVHHLMTNDPEHDPDIQHLPFLAVSTRFFNHQFSSYYGQVLVFDRLARFLVAYQHRLYYLILAFGRFNLHIMSFRYLLTSNKVRNPRLEWIGIFIFFTWYGALLAQLPTVSIRVMYVMVSYALTFPLHVQITLSHFGMSTEPMAGEIFPVRQIRTTMDVECPDWLDWFYGGLQYQTVHHLFPRLPRHYYSKAVPLIRQFCQDAGLHYYLYGFVAGNGVVLGGLKAVADQLRLLKTVADHNANSLVLVHDKKQV